MKLPQGYSINWMGEYESLKRAEARLLIIVPVTVFFIFMIIYGAFGSAKWACLHMVNVAVARIGGLLALLVTGTFFSVSSGVGFMALFGCSVQTGVVMVEYINQLRARGYPVVEAAIEGATRRLRPIMMTMLVATLGPFACGHVPRHRVRLAAAFRHSHRWGADRRPFHEHLPVAYLLRMVGAAHRSPAQTGRSKGHRC